MHKQWPMVLFVAALGVTLIAGTSVRAQSVTQSGEVTVVRGNDHSGDRRQYRSSPDESGVTVVRGNQRTTQQTPQPPQPTQGANNAPTRIGGRYLWFVHPTQNRVVGCSIQFNVYGKRYVDCTHGDY